MLKYVVDFVVDEVSVSISKADLEPRGDFWLSNSNDDFYFEAFDTFDEAKAYLKDRIEQRIVNYNLIKDKIGGLQDD